MPSGKIETGREIFSAATSATKVLSISAHCCCSGPAPGRKLMLVKNTCAQPIAGTFANLPEGATLTAAFGAQTFLLQISYTGGDGNDATLTVVSQTITFPAIATKQISDAPFTLSATASSG